MVRNVVSIMLTVFLLLSITGCGKTATSSHLSVSSSQIVAAAEESQTDEQLASERSDVLSEQTTDNQTVTSANSSNNTANRQPTVTSKLGVSSKVTSSSTSSVEQKLSARILYVGNSMIFVGRVPGQVKNLLNMYGIYTDYNDISLGAAALIKLKDKALDWIQTEELDYVVLQYDGDLLTTKLLCDAANKHGVVPVIYCPAWAGAGDVDKEKLLDMDMFARQLAKEHDALVVSAGAAWVYANEKMPEVFKDHTMIQEDNIHYTDAGAYLTACVFISTLFNVHVKDVTDKNLYHGDLAIPLGQAAWEYVQYYKENGKVPDGPVTVPPGTNKRVN